jgi:hypothetical protein
VGGVVGKLVVGRAASSRVRCGVATYEWYAPAHNDNGNNAKMWFNSVDGVANGYPNYAKDICCYWEVGPAPSPATDPLS